MGIQKVSDAQIAITIVPKRARWPEPGTCTSWAAAHDCVDALHNLMREVDLACCRSRRTTNFLRALSLDAAPGSATRQ